MEGNLGREEIPPDENLNEKLEDNLERSLEVVDEAAGRENAEQLQVEMPEDLDDPEGEAGKWKTVKGEVEIEGKKVEVTYREKVIELPKHRQEETGIKRIRRRELLPPFPENLYDNNRLAKNGSVKLSPAYKSDKKFDDFYQFLTNDKFPASDALVHVIHWEYESQNIENISRTHYAENLNLMKGEGLYFQKIYAISERKHKADTSEESFYINQGRIWYDMSFATPVFIFSNKNRKFMDFVKNVDSWAAKQISKDVNSSEAKDNKEVEIDMRSYKQVESLRWCNADLALIPTKRSLNVLFFETGDPPSPEASEGHSEEKSQQENNEE